MITFTAIDNLSRKEDRGGCLDVINKKFCHPGYEYKHLYDNFYSYWNLSPVRRSERMHGRNKEETFSIPVINTRDWMIYLTANGNLRKKIRADVERDKKTIAFIPDYQFKQLNDNSTIIEISSRLKI